MTEERQVSIWPNAVTLSRLALAPVLVLLLACWASSIDAQTWVWWLAAGVFGIGMATDALDGYLARRLDSVTRFGRMIDPLVDKVLTQSAFVMLAALPATGAMVPAWAVALILAREVVITGLRGWAEAEGLDFSASPFGKAKTASQTVAILVAFTVPALAAAAPAGAPSAAFGLVMLSLALTLGSGIDYCLRLRRALTAAD